MAKYANQASRSNLEYVNNSNGERVRNLAYKGPRGHQRVSEEARATATTGAVMSNVTKPQHFDPNDPFLTDDERSEVQGKLEKQADRALPAEVTMAKSAAKRAWGKTKSFFTHKPSGPPTTGHAGLDRAIDKSLTF